MTVRTKRKIFSCFLEFLFIFSPVICLDNKTDNGSVIMKISDHKNSDSLQPRILISRHNAEMKEEKNRAKETQTNGTGTILQSNVSDRSERSFYRLNFPHNLDIIGEVLLKLKNDRCVEDTTLALKAMAKHERWAVEMFDSFPKFPVGILYGNYFQLGNYDECVGAKNLITSDNDTKVIQGQYCLADIHFKPKTASNGRTVRSAENKSFKRDRISFNNTVIHWGICVPSTCTREDASIFTREVFSTFAENFEVVSVIVDDDKCSFDETIPFTSLEIIYGSILGCFLIFIVFATGFHCWCLRRRRICTTYNVDSLRTREKSMLEEIITCFSVMHTISRFLHTKPNELNLECICGMKFLSMTFIIGGHALIFLCGGPLENRKFFDTEVTSFKNGMFTNNVLLVDTFLLISGFLMCRLLLIELDKRKGKINFAILYIARYIRLTPSYIVVIGLYTTFLYRMGSGPLWESKVGLERDRCLDSWWTNIIYVNNYVNTEHLCMFQSWYLAVDYHLFIIAPFIVYPIWRWSKIGESMLFICTAASVVVTFWLTYKNNLDPTLMVYPPEINDISTNFYFVNVYIKTHMRASSYCIGILFGYIVHRLQKAGSKISSYIVYLGWLLCITLGITAMFSVLIFYYPEHEYNAFESAIYASLHRLAWCLAMGWILLTCITDNAAMVNKFLSHKVFIPASRLTYCAYLANGLIEVYNIGVLRQPSYMSRFELTTKLLGHLLLTYALAFVLCIFFESPIHGLEKLLLRRDKMREVKQQSTLRPTVET